MNSKLHSNWTPHTSGEIPQGATLTFMQCDDGHFCCQHDDLPMSKQHRPRGWAGRQVRAHRLQDRTEHTTDALAEERCADGVACCFRGISPTPDDQARGCHISAHQQLLAEHPGEAWVWPASHVAHCGRVDDRQQLGRRKRSSMLWQQRFLAHNRCQQRHRLR